METIRYFEMFSLVLFIGIMLLRSLILSFEGITVFTIGRKKKTSVLLYEILFVPLIILWLVVHFQELFFNISKGFLSVLSMHILRFQGQDIIGMVMVITSLLFLVGALLAFGRSWRVGIDTQKPGELIINGLFSISRNPVFLSIDMYFLGTLFMHPTWFNLVCTLLMLVLIHKQILNEEKHLEKHYGEAYTNYKTRTPRYLFA